MTLVFPSCPKNRAGKSSICFAQWTKQTATQKAGGNSRNTWCLGQLHCDGKGHLFQGDSLCVFGFLASCHTTLVSLCPGAGTRRMVSMVPSIYTVSPSCVFNRKGFDYAIGILGYRNKSDRRWGQLKVISWKSWLQATFCFVHTGTSVIQRRGS